MSIGVGFGPIISATYHQYAECHVASRPVSVQRTVVPHENVMSGEELSATTMSDRPQVLPLLRNEEYLRQCLDIKRKTPPERGLKFA